MSVVSVCAGASHNVFVMDGGHPPNVKAFGQDNDGRCRIPDFGDRKCVQACAGGGHTVLLLDDTSVMAFGSNYAGQCTVPERDDGQICLQVGAGSSHTLIILKDTYTQATEVKAFGRNVEGQCNVPLHCPPVAQVAGGGWHTILVCQNGTCKSFGQNDQGQCKLPMFGQKSKESEGHIVQQAAAGSEHTLCLVDNGFGGRAVWSYGLNTSGQCDVPDFEGRRPKKIEAGWHHSVILFEDGSVMAFGDNSRGQCALPEPEGRKCLDVSAGWGHTTILFDDGSVTWANATYDSSKEEGPPTTAVGRAKAKKHPKKAGSMADETLSYSCWRHSQLM